MATVTRENCETAQYFEHVSVKNADGTPARARRNGKTKLWKTRPERFKIPVKHGLRDYFYIQNFYDNQIDNDKEWNVVK